MDVRRRWDDDERGIGVADAARTTPAVTSLAGKSAEQGWVAEEPEVHLIPHLLVAAVAAGIEMRVVDGTADSLEIAVAQVDAADRRTLRAQIFALVGAIAEASTHVREVEPGRVYEVVTGMLDGDGLFAPHGHVLRIVIEQAPVQATSAQD